MNSKADKTSKGPCTKNEERLFEEEAMKTKKYRKKKLIKNSPLSIIRQPETEEEIY